MKKDKYMSFFVFSGGKKSDFKLLNKLKKCMW